MARKFSRDFIVDSNGYCFLCQDLMTENSQLNHRSDSFTESSLPNTSSPQSIEYLARYLKLDMSKLFKQAGPIPPHLLDEVTRSRLKAPLCEECAEVAEKFSNLCKQLEKIQFQINFSLDEIKNKLTRAAVKHDSIPGLELFSGFEETFQVVESLRKETLDKCGQKLVNILPRIKVQRLRRREIAKEHLKFRKNRKEDNNKQSSSNDNQVKVEQEKPNVNADDSLFGSQQKAGSCCSESDKPPTANKDNTTDEDTPAISGAVVVSVEFSDSHNRPRYCCRFCSKSFLDPSIQSRHAKTCNLRQQKTAAGSNSQIGCFTCDICQQSFGTSKNMLDHKLVYHYGERFECDVCHQKFLRRVRRDKHRQVCPHLPHAHATEPASRLSNRVSDTTGNAKPQRKSSFNCSYCDKKLSTMKGMKYHMNFTHLNKELAHECQYCQKKFPLKTGRDIHIKTVHTRERVQCKYCSVWFATIGSLNRHVKNRCKKRAA